MQDIYPILLQYWPLALGVFAAGAFAGVLAGLLGVGGGIVIVPVLFLLLDAFGIDDGIAMKVAVGTSLATIMVTALSSARSHRKRGAVDDKLLRSWALPIVVGVVVGTALAGFVHGDFLTVVFATVALLVAANMFLRRDGTKLYSDFPNWIVSAVSAFVVGFVSSLMGIGGGTLAVPIMTTFGYDIRRAVGTSSAIGFAIAVPGAIGYAAIGWNAAGLPPGSLGFVNIPAFIAFVPLTVLFAPLGAYLAHRIPQAVLRYAFGAFLLLTSIRMFLAVFA